jgi:primosomal protein N' (replication factor Y)
VDVCVAVPRLSLDRPFTYLLPGEAGAGTGSLVSVPFHGRTVRAWVLGPSADVPSGRLLPIRSVRSPVRFFDPARLALLRWVSERYLAPLTTVIERSHPPRVASEEPRDGPGPADATTRPSPGGTDAGPWAPALEAGRVSWVRPLPGKEGIACVEAVEACLASGRSAVVLVPEAEPLPATAAAVLEAFGERAVGFLGGDARTRYRTWLDILSGRYRVVVGTRPAVFAPVPRVGLLWISREVHPGHREERSPYYHVREVAGARARIEGAGCVLASLSPSVETAVAAASGAVRTLRAPRQAERAAAPLVETAPPEAEDRSARLSALLKRAGSAALVVSRRGYGVARVCRSCSEPAACAACRGPIVVERGAAVCGACGAPGRCRNCGGVTFGVERGGAERIREWAGRIASAPVAVAVEGQPPPAPSAGRVLVGTAATVKDVGPARVDLVAILDPDRALARPGLHAGEQALATWMEAAVWAGPRGGGGRVLLQTRRPAHPAVQALVRWEPVAFLLAEAAGRAEAGFPPGRPVFRLAGTEALPGTLEAAGTPPLLATAAVGGTICLVPVRPEDLASFRDHVLSLVAAGVVTRVEAEPQL